MAAKESQEMRDALRLVSEGVPVRVAAETAGVWFTSLYARLAKSRARIEADGKAKGVAPRVSPQAVARRMVNGSD